MVRWAMAAANWLWYIRSLKKAYFLKNIGFAASAKVFTKSKVFEKKVSKRDIPINWVLIMI